MRVLVVAEYYPRAGDPTLGVWAHHQTRAARDAGAEVRVLVLHRPVPPLAVLRGARSPGGARRALRALRDAVAQPPRAMLDGITIDYLRYVSPPRPWSYPQWGAWAAPPLRAALRRIRREFRFDLVHAHYAVPAGDAVRRASPGCPLLISVHGGDVHGRHAGSRQVVRALSHARLVLANSTGTAHRCRAAGARATRVVHLGTDVPAQAISPPERPVLVTVGNLIARKRHADVIEALARLRERHPTLVYEVIGDGPRRAALESLAAELGVGDRVRFHGRLPHEEAVRRARAATLFVLPSVAEAFGVAYVEAMAAGVPAVGSRGEDGPEEIAAAGGGIKLVTPRDPVALADALDALLSDSAELQALRRRARATVADHFTWRRCGTATVAAYQEILDG